MRRGKKLSFSVLAYVIMPEHVHLVVWPRQQSYDIAIIRGAIKQPVSRRAMLHLEQHAPDWLDRLTRQRGKHTERLFWQSGSGYDRNIVDSRTLEQMVDYIHANPLRRRLVDRSTDWYWSSARCYAGMDDGPLAMDSWPW